MNDCMMDLFFYDDCSGPAVFLGNFAAGLTAAMIKKRTNVMTISDDQVSTIAQVGMDVAWQMTPQMDELGTECFLQLCNWHAAEAIKKRLTCEGYLLETRKVLADQVRNSCRCRAKSWSLTGSIASKGSELFGQLLPETRASIRYSLHQRIAESRVQLHSTG